MALIATLKGTGLLAIPMAFVFLSTGLLVNALQLLLYIVVRPFSVKTFRILNQNLVPINWSLFVFLADWWAGLKMRCYGSKEVWEHLAQDKSLCIVNHRSDIDWLLGWMLAERFGLLGGTKALMKESAKYLPVLGWCWWFCEFIWLKRDWASDKDTMQSGLSSLQGYPLPYWVVIFPEGTRYTPKKHQESQEFARQKGLPVLNHLLTPKPKGFAFAVRAMRNDIDAVYTCTMAFKNNQPPNMVSLLKGQGGEVHAYARRFMPSELPEDEKELTDWLNNLFVEMDKVLAYHAENGKYPGEEYPLETTTGPLYMSIFWFVLHGFLWAWLVYGWFMSGNWLALGIMFALIAMGGALINVMIHYSKAKDKPKKERTEAKKIQ